MVQPSDRTDAPHLALWTALTAVFVAALGAFAFLHPPEAAQDYGIAFIGVGGAVVALFCLAVAGVAVTRFVVLPAAAQRDDASPERVVTLGYLLAILPALYGLAAVVLSGEGWFAAPFSSTALFAALDLWIYFASACRAGESQGICEEADWDGPSLPRIDEEALTETALSYVRSVQNVDRVVNLVVTSLRAPKGSH